MNAIPRPFYAEQALYECFMNSLSLAGMTGFDAIAAAVRARAAQEPADRLLPGGAR